MSYCEKTYCENVTEIILALLPDGYDSWSDEELASYLDSTYNATDEFKEYITVCYDFINEYLLADNILRILDLWLFGPHGCDNPRYDFLMWLKFAIIPATLIIIILTILQERKSSLIPWCQPKVGLQYTVNLLDGYTDRLAYACCFGFTSSCILDLFRGEYYLDIDYNCIDVSRALKGALSTCMALLNVLLVGFVFAPFFMCITTPAKITGSFLGMLYTSYWAYFYTYSYAECPYLINDIDAKVFAIPLILSYYYMFLRFFFGFVISIHFKYSKIDIDGEDRPLGLRKLHLDYVYVHRLLQKPDIPLKPEKKTKMDKFKDLFYHSIPGFKYSRRILCTVFVCLLSLYQVNLIVLFIVGEPLRYGCEELFAEGGEAEEFFHSINQSHLFDEAALIVCVGYKTFRVSANISAIIHIVYLIHMLAVYRRYMLKMYKGDRSFWPPELKSNVSLLVASLRFSGYQIAYILWGYMISQLILWIAVLLLIYGFFLAIRDGRQSIILFLIAEYWFTAVIALLLYLLQIFTAKHVFLLDKGKGKAFGINNRRMYHVANYLLFFFNVILGLFSCLFRIGKALIFGLLFVGRTDKCLLMRGFEKFDTGFKAYLGFLKVEEAHTHPVLVTFCDLLANQIPRIRSDVTEADYDEETNAICCFKSRHKTTMVTETDIEIECFVQCYRRSRLARNRWFVAYTMIRNPLLMKERSSTLPPALRRVSDDGDDNF